MDRATSSTVKLFHFSIEHRSRSTHQIAIIYVVESIHPAHFGQGFKMVLNRGSTQPRNSLSLDAYDPVWQRTIRLITRDLESIFVVRPQTAHLELIVSPPKE